MSSRSGKMVRLGVLVALLAGLTVLGENLVDLLPKPDPAKVETDRTNVVLVIMDTMRADRLSLYGNPHRTSPQIDQLARHAIVFDRAIAQAPWTAPSVASIFTGTYQSVHGVTHRWNQSSITSVLGEQFHTLAEAFHDAGYRTAAFSSQAWTIPRTGFAQGFDTFDVVSSIDDIYETDRVMRSGIEWIGAHEDEPFFVYLHVLDPHSPYHAPPPFDELFWKGPPPPNMAPMTKLDVAGQWKYLLSLGREHPVEDEDLEWMLAMYDSEIAYVDHWVGALSRTLQEKGLSGKTLLVLVSDHGESFREHQVFGHGQRLWNPELHVPLVLVHPGWFPDQERVATPVGTMDLYPTLAELIGLELPPHVQGRSLMVQIPNPEPIYSEGANVSEIKLQDAEWSLITKSDYTKPKLYRIDEDPGERKNLAAEQPEVLERMLAELRRRYEANLASPWRAGDSNERRLDPEQAARLRAMGYIE
jgi:arylsulfatase A-like enzyme